jgi:signal transduction histidine kinase
LDTKMAYLAALGPLSPLVGPPLVFPPNIPIPTISLNDIVRRFITPAQMLVDLDKADGLLWGVPLWSERGLIGVILLGEKRGGGLYTQEEIEIARATGERLIDTQASAEIAQRLMGLQRQRMIESQILDQKTRRVLHDDILPLIHTSMLSLSSQNGSESNSDTIQSLATAHRQISDLLREMPGVINSEVSRKGVILALRQVLDEELKAAFEEICWKIEPGAEEAVRQLPSLSAEVLFYAAREVLRNAARHSRTGNSTRPIILKLEVCHRESLNIVIEDNGIGFSTERKSEKSSGGQGLVLHSTLMAVVGGTLVIESVPEQFTRVSLSLPSHL